MPEKLIVKFLSEVPSSREIGKWLERQGLSRVRYKASCSEGPYSKPKLDSCYFYHISFLSEAVRICISEPGRLATTIIEEDEGALCAFQKWVHERADSPIGALLELQLSRALEVFDDDKKTAEENAAQTPQVEKRWGPMGAI